MKTYVQMAAEVFEKGDRQIRENRKKKRNAAIMTVICAAVLGTGVYTAIKAKPQPQKTTVTSENYGGEITADTGGKTGDGSTQGVSFGTEIKTVGEKITDEEAARYFEENIGWFSSALSASGVPCDNLEICEKGYCHISLEEGELRQNFRDYLAYSGKKIVAIITVTKENGTLYSTPAFGAPWFEEFARFLNEHSGQKLVFSYAGMLEAVLCPDGECVNPMGTDVSGLFSGIENPYEAFYAEQAVYVP